MAKITLMVGLPASGKSTKAEELLKRGGTVRINKDLLRTMLHCDKFTGINEGMTRDAARTLAKTFLSQGVNVIIDDTNLNPGTLQSWKDLGKELDAKIEYCRLDTSVEECLRRDKARGDKVGAHVIIQMALQHLQYMKGEKVVLCDLDGTLCDISHRLKFVKNLPEGGKKDWKSFFAAIPEDTIRTEVLNQLLKLEEEGNKIIFVSARPDTYRKETEEWLEKNLNGYKLHTALLMRDSRDSREDTLIKSEVYDKFLKHLSITKIFDDRPSVIRMWREKGLEVVDVGSGVEF